jgi:[protein-PII] uridylyltransferase
VLIDLRRIDSHAERRLDDLATADHSGRLQAFKGFLKIELERLRMRHRFGLAGVEIAGARAYLVDLVVRRVCEVAAIEVDTPLDSIQDGFSALALGGYGRRELAPHSDVDVLFLHGGRSTRTLQPLVEKALLLLWDVGLTVGHSFRSLEECVTMVRTDLHSRNSLAEARLITGSPSLVRRLEDELMRAVYSSRRTTTAYLEAMRAEWRERRAKFGDVVCMLEPNVKESAGGLRDLHTTFWVGHARFGCHTLAQLLEGNHISRTEASSARRGYDFLTRVRNEAHFATGRQTDQLTLELQPTVAENLGFDAKGGLEGSERLMREYYGRAQELLSATEGILQRLWSGRRVKLPWPARRVGPRQAFEVRNGRLFSRRGIPRPTDDPHWLFEVYEAAQEADVPLSGTLKLSIRRRLKLVGRRFRSSPAAGQSFLRILRRPGRVARTLRMMHETGFLGRFLPEFGYITFLVQHDYYHKYTIDEHTLECLAALDAVVDSEDPRLAPYAGVFRELRDPASLYLGLFMHDIGKGRGGGHVGKGVEIAERVCERLLLDQEITADVVFLVRCHLLMSQISQRRDLSEDQPIDELLAEIRGLDQLHQLLLLTYADLNGVGPGIWNSWKGALLWELYSKARGRLTSGSAPSGSAGDGVRRRALEELAPEVPASVIEEHYALLPERYQRLIDLPALTRDLRLVGSLDEAPLVAEWRSSGEHRPDELTVCTRDSPGLLASMAGTLTAEGLNILSVDLYTRADGIALDTFTVTRIGEFRPVDPERRAGVEARLRAAVDGSYDVEDGVSRWRAQLRRRKKVRRPTAPEIRFDDDASPTSTVIEVRADDEPGLVHRIARTLAECGVQIGFAKVATDKSCALDIFYVTDQDGEKLPSALMARVESALLKVLGKRRGTEE